MKRIMYISWCDAGDSLTSSKLFEFMFAGSQSDLLIKMCTHKHALEKSTITFNSFIYKEYKKKK